MKKQEDKNLKHGYLFLAGIILFLFAVSLSTEIYLKGGFAFAKNEETPQKEEMINDRKDEEETFVEIQNLKDGFKTKDESITVVAFTNLSNKAWINGNEVEVNNEGVIEGKVHLIVGENEILVAVENDSGQKKSQKLTVTREKKEEPKKQEREEQTPQPKETVQPPIQNPTPQPEPEPDPIPQPDPITGLKMQCSITNTMPYVGQTVSINCTVRDQNNSPVNGATGSVTVNWQSGSQTYSLPSSNGSGVTSVSFTVPNGNSGKVNGNVRVSKSGLTVTSNFSLTVQ